MAGDIYDRLIAVFHHQGALSMDECDVHLQDGGVLRAAKLYSQVGPRAQEEFRRALVRCLHEPDHTLPALGVINLLHLTEMAGELARLQNAAHVRGDPRMLAEYLLCLGELGGAAALPFIRGFLTPEELAGRPEIFQNALRSLVQIDLGEGRAAIRRFFTADRVRQSLGASLSGRDPLQPALFQILSQYGEAALNPLLRP